MVLLLRNVPQRWAATLAATVSACGLVPSKKVSEALRS